MRHPIILVLMLPLLAGCSDFSWRRLTSFDTSEPPQQAERAAPPPARVATAAPAPGPAADPAPPAPNAFCLATARQDSTDKGFDPATQNRVALRSYQQCVTLFGNQP